MHDEAETWSNGPGFFYPEHSHPYHKKLTCLKGSITFTVHGKNDVFEVVLKPGDVLELPPGTLHSALVGEQGCTCSEVHTNP